MITFYSIPIIPYTLVIGLLFLFRFKLKIALSKIFDFIYVTTNDGFLALMKRKE